MQGVFMTNIGLNQNSNTTREPTRKIDYEGIIGRLKERKIIEKEIKLNEFILKGKSKDRRYKKPVLLQNILSIDYEIDEAAAYCEFYYLYWLSKKNLMKIKEIDSKPLKNIK